MLEDTAAVAGVGIAFTAVSLSAYFNTPVYDCCGSIAIGVLLGVVAAQIIRTNAVHLVGRSLPKRITDDIVIRLLNDPAVRSVHDVKATSLGVEKARFKAEIDFNGREITRAYLRENCDLDAMLLVIANTSLTISLAISKQGRLFRRSSNWRQAKSWSGLCASTAKKPSIELAMKSIGLRRT
jgi:zinc transporter 9